MKTVILGASTNPSRYSYIAAEMLDRAGLDFVPVGRRNGVVFGREILNIQDKPQINDVHTITLYIGTYNLTEWFDYILGLSPRRIIFNPGTENMELSKLAREKGIEVEFACTLTMITVGSYQEAI